MRRNYFLRKKILETGQRFFLLVARSSKNLYKLVFAKRTILFVTKEKIRSVTLGPFLQACLFLALAWVGSLFIQSLQHDKIVRAKSDEIYKLQTVNSYFEEEITVINDKLKKVNEYLISVTGEKHEVKVEEKEISKPQNFQEESLSNGDKYTFDQIKLANNQIFKIEAIANSRIRKIEDVISIAGLNIKKIPGREFKEVSEAQIREISLKDEKSSPNSKIKSLKGQGGPLLANDSLEGLIDPSLSEDDLERHLEKVKFNGNIDYLMVLEKLAQVMPLSYPMRDYYISSGFGKRVDPLTGGLAQHRGLDFVGAKKEEILSPSDGVVVLAGKYYDYGNAIVIDHGFGITTRYGHLSEVKVKKGQHVTQGQVIGLQGNSGRSTGAHLHYEVRYKNTPMNPRKFLKAGEMFFNDDKVSKYVNS